MRSTTTSLLLAALASTISAQTGATSSTPPASGCGSQIDLTIATCLTNLQIQATSCGPVDWDCKCNAQKALNTCYANCPSDPNAFGAKQTELSWCNAAKAYPSSTTSAPTGMKTSAAVASPSSSTDNGAIMPSGTSAPSASSTSKPNAAAGIMVPAGGVLAAVAGLVALL